MTKPDHASTWHDAMKRARLLDPDNIIRAILADTDSGLRAQRFDAQGGRTTSVGCQDPHCHDGDPEYVPHSHMILSDPTGNAAVNGHRNDTTSRDVHHVKVARKAFVSSAGEVLDFVCGDRPATWSTIRLRNAQLSPGTIQAGVDVDHEHFLPYHITRVAKAVTALEGATKRYSPRAPSTDEQHWTAGLAPGDCCDWHMEIHDRYRRPRVAGTNICQACINLATLLGQKPPRHLLEAEVDRESKPKAWTAALGRCMDELGVMREAG